MAVIMDVNPNIIEDNMLLDRTVNVLITVIHWLYVKLFKETHSV